MGYDPLFQFMHEDDVTEAIVQAATQRHKGVFNVAGPDPVPLSIIGRETGRPAIFLPEFVMKAALGRFGLPNLSSGALTHIKFPVTIDGSRFRDATGFQFRLRRRRHPPVLPRRLSAARELRLSELPAKRRGIPRA